MAGTENPGGASNSSLGAQSNSADETTLNAQKREQSRQMLRQVRGQIGGGTGTLGAPRPTQAVPNPPQPDSPISVTPLNSQESDAFFDELFTENVLKPYTPPPTVAKVAVPVAPVPMTHHIPAQPTINYKDVAAAARFQPRNLSTKPEREMRDNKRGWLDIVGLILEGLLIIALAIIIGYFLIEQFGWFQPSLNSSSNVTSSDLNPLWSNGAIINVDAGNTFLNLPTTAPTNATSTTQATVSPTATLTQAVHTPSASAKSSIALPATFTPLIAPTGTPLPAKAAPTPTVAPIITTRPAPVDTTDYSQSPPTRLVIPRLGLDTPVKDVTVQLGSWQVADYAAGHNLGTANPGEVGNMVLAGHRDIRGSVFLHLPELQKGDLFTVYSAAGAFRYSVTEIFEVAPTDISVMNPTTTASATLITCTPLGTSNRRLIVRARLVE